MDNNFIYATIRQFKAIPVSSYKEINEVLPCAADTIPQGFVLSPYATAEYAQQELKQIVNIVSEVYGLTGEQMNSSFHKSWKKVRDTSKLELLAEQVMHYLTTYGFRKLGIYHREWVYMPAEELELPEVEGGLSLMVIKGLTYEALKEQALSIMQKGIALKKRTINDLVLILQKTGVTPQDVETVANREVKLSMYHLLDILPENPVEVLRLLVYEATGRTLLIKDANTINAIKQNISKEYAQANRHRINWIDFLNKIEALRRIFDSVGPAKLSTVFYRFKPLFLAFRNGAIPNRYVNNIRRLAKKNHKPMPSNFLNNITTQINQGQPREMQSAKDSNESVTSGNTDVTKGHRIDRKRLAKHLEQENIFRKVRLLYALGVRMKQPSGMLYTVRNGKTYATENSLSPWMDEYQKVYDIVLQSIVDSLQVQDVKFYMPAFIDYALPATERQFVGHYPAGTVINVTEDFVAGIYWKEKNKGTNIDLDLSMLLPEGEKIGWNGEPRANEGNILFSGDMTEAPAGAAELFYIKKQPYNVALLMNNLYNGPKGVPFKFYVAQEKPKTLEQNYMVNPANVLLSTTIEMFADNKLLGIVIPEETHVRFVLTDRNLHPSTVAAMDEKTAWSRDFLYHYYNAAVKLREVFTLAGAQFVEQSECEIDLSPEKLDKDTFISLLTEGKHSEFVAEQLAGSEE